MESVGLRFVFVLYSKLDCGIHTFIQNIYNYT